MAPGYLEEGKPCFTKVTKEYEEELNRDDIEKEPTNLEEKTIKKRAQRKKKRDAWTTSLAVVHLSRRLLVPGSSAPPLRSSIPPSPSVSGMRVPRSSAPPPGSSAPPSSSTSDVRMLESSAPSTFGAPMPGSSTPPSPSGHLPVPGLSALRMSDAPRSGLSAPLMSGASVSESSALPSPSDCLPLPGSSAPSPSGCLPVPGSSLHGSSPPFPIWLSSQTPTPVPGK